MPNFPPCTFTTISRPIYRLNFLFFTIKFSTNAKVGISNDTGCGHLIANSGIPLITIFGPTNSEKFRPIGNPYNKIISSVKEYGSNDINTIKPELLIEKFNKLIKEVG